MERTERARQRWRTIVAAVCIVVACLLAPLSVVAVWTRNQVTNTDRYVATVSPLASDPAIQDAVADQITAQVLAYIDIQGLTTQAVEALAVVAEAAVAWELARAARDKFGGDALSDFVASHAAYLERISWHKDR